MLMVEVYHTHPVLRTFVELLNQTKTDRLERETSGFIVTEHLFIVDCRGWLRHADMHETLQIFIVQKLIDIALKAS